ncbi:hypothetical protein NP233_g11912 [Leucocoprinus birnbaumii]|uniref:Nephrocystin 3-like N-terminal domain-containing protein n=1 Tax=Leucocoprinus birnbaumii TaxID=56174 RepID=A0AAD5VFF0_9AGAR|nr:hypothetical protein NP233_g11912 [Leucocoprinus birnbaumii]
MPTEYVPHSDSSTSSFSHCILDRPHFEDKTYITNIQVQNVIHDYTTSFIERTSEDFQSSGIRLLRKVLDTTIMLYSFTRPAAPPCFEGIMSPKIRKLVDAILEDHAQPPGVISVYGPVGVGKSINARSFSERLAEEGKLACAVFLPHQCLREGHFHSKKVLPTIAYHIAVEDEAFGRALGKSICRNPALLEEAIPQQFYNLLVAPSREIQPKKVKRFIVVDGIEQFRGNAVQEIIDASATPGFGPIELTISRELDSIIERLLVGGLGQIGKEHGFAPPWPSRKLIDAFIERAGGFPLYAASLVDFVRTQRTDPKQLLQTILDNREWILPQVDEHYTLFLQNLTPAILDKAQKILLAVSILPHRRTHLATINQFLNIPEREIDVVCRTLRPVLQLIDGGANGYKISFYHSTFMEFMQDLTRSKGLSLWSCAENVRCSLLTRLKAVQENAGQEDFVTSSITACIEVESVPELNRFIPDMGRLMQNLPDADRHKIIRSVQERSRILFIIDRIRKPPYANMDSSYILGRGSRRAYCWGAADRDYFVLTPPQHPLTRLLSYLIPPRPH